MGGSSCVRRKERESARAEIVASLALPQSSSHQPALSDTTTFALHYRIILRTSHLLITAPLKLPRRHLVPLDPSPLLPLPPRLRQLPLPPLSAILSDLHIPFSLRPSFPLDFARQARPTTARAAIRKASDAVPPSRPVRAPTRRFRSRASPFLHGREGRGSRTRSIRERR